MYSTPVLTGQLHTVHIQNDCGWNRGNLDLVLPFVDIGKATSGINKEHHVAKKKIAKLVEYRNVLRTVDQIDQYSVESRKLVTWEDF